VVEDAPAMAHVNAAGWREGYRGIVPDERLDHLPEADWRRQMTAGLEAPRLDAFTRIAELDGEFAGYCFVAAPGREEPDDSRTAELVALYVHERFWRRGVGSALITAALERLAALGRYEEVFLWTFEQNVRAISFYRAFGFAPDGGRRPFVPIGTPTIRMRRPLP
jgi:ribosomal protein S18 acetylase RimI-like enzyme